jgi:hypothetical protein
MSGHRVLLQNLSVELLEKDAAEYFRILDVLSRNEDLASALTGKLNETPYVTWFSNHVFALSRLVGKMNQGALDEGTLSYYGSTIPEGIDENLAVSLLRKMVECGGNILAKDYYDEDVMEHFESPEISNFYRTNNEEYCRVVKELYGQSLLAAHPHTRDQQRSLARRGGIPRSAAIEKSFPPEENHKEKVSQEEADPESASVLWPKASEAMINGNFKGAAALFRKAFQESRGWNNFSEEPYTIQEQLLLKLILISETHVNR